MARPIWRGHITFGLVNVPVVLHSAERRSDIGFHLIDSRDAARIRYERINEETGEEVPWDAIVKGFEYDDGNYVLLSDEEMAQASVAMTRTIEIEQFVDLADIDIRYFERPYVLVPSREGEHGYTLLREAIAKSGKTGIANVVIRSRQYLAALIASGDALMLELLRYEQELRDLGQFDLPGSDLRKAKISKKEIGLARQLIDGMSDDWNPSAYRDEYRDVLMKLIEKKIDSGHTEIIETETPSESPAELRTINFMDVLKKSLEGKSVRKGGKHTAGSKRKSSRVKRKSKNRRAG